MKLHVGNKFLLFYYMFTLHIHVFTNFLGHGGNNLGRPLQVLLSDSVRIQMYIVGNEITHWQWNSTVCFIFTLSIYMFSLTSLVTVVTIPNVHCRFCSKTRKSRVRLQIHNIGHGIPPISVGGTEIAPSSF